MIAGVTLGRSALFGLLVCALVGCRGAVEWSAASTNPTLGPTATALGSLLPSSTPLPSAPVGLGLQWIDGGSFGDGDAVEFANAVVRGSSVFVAVGTHFKHALDPSGPLPPHDGRVWVSPDGRSWTAVTLPDIFADAALDHVFTTAEGSFIAIGGISIPGGTDDGGGLEPLAAWESADGLTWQRVDIGLPSNVTMQSVAQGAGGHLAVLRPQLRGAEGAPQLWLSTDGISWEQVYVVTADERAVVDIGAGDEGFVAVGYRTRGDIAETFAIASADGRHWIESSSAPVNARHVAPLGSDWIAIATGEISPGDTETPVWFSANGIDWSEIGNLPLNAAEPDQLSCGESVAGLTSAAGWLIVSTVLSYPCSEGGVVGYGTQRISVDGAATEPLPFARFSYSPSTQVREDGSIVLAATRADGGLVLVGQSNGQATFWIGEAP